MEFHLNTDPALLCRVCMSDAPRIDAYTSIYLPLSNPDQLSLHGMLSAICAPVFSVSVDVDEHDFKDSLGMPKSVCPDCKMAIERAYDLRKLCIETDRKLWEMIMIKQELQENVEGQDPLSETNAETSTAIGKIGESDKKADDTVENPVEHQPKVVKQTNDTLKTCKICSEVQTSETSLKLHLRRMHPETIHKCETCRKIFESKTLLENHKMGHDTGQLHACPFCTKRFKSYSGIRAHKAIQHSDKVQAKSFVCSLCNKEYWSKHCLKVHMRRHTGEKPFTCELCPSRFFSKGEVVSHMTTHTKERNHVCDMCGNRFTTHRSLVSHVRTVHAGERRYPCTVCDMRFTISEHLKRHMRTHTGEKPYKCAYCERAYAQSNDLVKHSKIHVGENPYSCDQCDANFRLLTELRDHYKVHKNTNTQGSSSNGQETAAEREPIKFTILATLNRKFEQQKRQIEGQTQESTK